MTPEPNFEGMSFKPFTVNEHSTIEPELDPDTNFFESISSPDTKYFTVNETKTFVNNIDSESFTILHLNIRSIKKKTLKVSKNSLRIYYLISVQFFYLGHGANQ